MCDCCVDVEVRLEENEETSGQTEEMEDPDPVTV